MTRLTPDQCRNLKAWGYPQDTELAYCEGTLMFRRIYWPAFGDSVPDNVTACPTLEELLEWMKNEFWKLQHDGLDYWEIQGQDYNEAIHIIRSPSPLEAAYALCEALYAKKEA